MEASLVSYFELEETDKADEAEQETLLSEEDSSPEETALTDDSTTLTDADLTESDPPADETESAAIGDNADCASIAKGTVSYTASAQTEFSEKTEAEKPPEGSTQDTQ